MTSTGYFRTFVLAAVASIIRSSRGAAPPQSSLAMNDTPTLYLLSLLPYPSTDSRSNTAVAWDQGPSLYVAGELAIELINNNSDILSGYSLELLRGDGGCNLAVSRGSRQLVQKLFYNGGKNVLGVVGPGCSPAGLFVSNIISTKENDISLLTLHLGTSPLFDARESKFPYSFSMLAHTDTVATAIIEVMKHNNWNDVVVLYDESQIYFTTLLERFVELQVMGEDSTIPVASLIFENYIPFDDISRSEKRIILLLVGSNLISRILCVSFRYINFAYPLYQWMFVGRAIDDFTPVNTFYDGKPVACELSDLLEMAQQSIFFQDHLEPLDETKVSYFGLTYTEIMQRYIENVKRYNYTTSSSIQPSVWGPAYFDAIWTMALALNNSVLELRSKNLELAEFKYGQNEVTRILRNNLLALSFEGWSGRIEFNSTTGFVNRGVDILQLQEGKLKNMLHFNKTHLLQTGTPQLEAIEDSFDNYGTFSTVPVQATALILVITLFLLVVLIGLQCCSVVLRRTRSVKANSLKIIQVAFSGCYLTIVGIICESIATFLSEHRVIKCQIEQASFSVLFFGMTLIFATILVRTWRLYRIFVHYIDPGNLVSDKYLFIFICFCVVLELPVVLGWGITDPILPIIIRNANLQLRRVYCTSKFSLAWFLVLITYNGTLLLISCFFALLCNKIPQRDFKSNSILNLAYVITLELTVGVTIYILIRGGIDPMAEFLTKNITLLIYMVSCCLLLFLPPLLPVIKHRLQKSGRERRGYFKAQLSSLSLKNFL